MSSITDQAIEAIGKEQPSDYLLKPRAHAKQLPDAAEPLRRVLGHPEISDIIDRFEAADKTADRWQTVYRLLSRLAFVSRFLAISIGALLLMQHVQPASKELNTLGLGIEYALIALSFLAMVMLALLQPFEKWMKARARAEDARVELFNKVSEAKGDGAVGGLPLLPLQLEFFRRYQLDTELLFYRKRGSAHARAAGQTAVWRWVTVALVALAVIPAGIALIATWAPQYLPARLMPAAMIASGATTHALLLVLGIFTSALADLVSALSLVSLNQRNAARYLSNADNLDFLKESYLEEARAAAASNDRDKVDDFISLAQMYISSEHREWVLARDVAQNLTLEGFAQLRLPGRRR